MSQSRAIVKQKINNAQQALKVQFDKSSNMPKLSMGDRVMVDMPAEVQGKHESSQGHFMFFLGYVKVFLQIAGRPSKKRMSLGTFKTELNISLLHSHKPNILMTNSHIVDVIISCYTY